MKCAFLQGDLDEQRVDDDDNFKIESTQRVPDTFCEPVPEWSRKLQLEHHLCIRLLKAVYGLVHAPRKLYHRVATDLRTNEEFVMGPCLWTFPDENGVIHALCLVCVDDFMLTCSDSPFGKHIFESSDNSYEWESGRYECSNKVAHKSLKPTISTLEHRWIRDQLHRT